MHMTTHSAATKVSDVASTLYSSGALYGTTSRLHPPKRDAAHVVW